MILEVNPRPHGGEDFLILALYPVNPPIGVGATGQTLVPTHSDTLPQIVDTYNLVPQAVRDQLNAGSAMFEILNIHRNPGVTQQDLLNKVKARYPTRAAALVASLRRRYEITGQTVDIV